MQGSAVRWLCAFQVVFLLLCKSCEGTPTHAATQGPSQPQNQQQHHDASPGNPDNWALQSVGGKADKSADKPKQKLELALSPSKSVVLPSGLRVEAYVVSLPSQPDRLNNFKAAWQKTWPDMEPSTIPGIMDSVRGKGVLKAYISGARAISDRSFSHTKSASSAQANPDFVLFFEDDARAFAGVSWPSDLDKMLTKLPPSASTLVLGGHHFGKKEEPQLDANNLPTITQIDKAVGCYGWVARFQALPKFVEVWEAHLAEELDMYSVDIAWWKVWESMPAYVATPLFVDHPPGYSNTWKKMRNDAWSGRRDWWNLDPFPSSPPSISLPGGKVIEGVWTSLPPDF